MDGIGGSVPERRFAYLEQGKLLLHGDGPQLRQKASPAALCVSGWLRSNAVTPGKLKVAALNS